MTVNWYDSPEFAEFEEVWFEDTEFISLPGERPDVLCLCAYELRTGRRIELWDEQIGPTPPSRTDRRVLHIVFAGTAECGCYLAKGWPLPARLLDLSPMFRCYINGRKVPPEGKGLIGALSHFNLNTAGEKYKEAMRARIMQGRPFSPEEIAQGIAYCWTDVDEMPALLKCLLERMPPYVTLGTLLHWGEFVAVSAVMEHNGIPMDMEIASLMLDEDAWSFVRDAIVPSINSQFGVYVQDKTGQWSFNTEQFEEYCKHGPDCPLGRTCRRGQDCQRAQDCVRGPHETIVWPRHQATGKLDLRRKTFDSMAKAFSQVEALRQLRYTRDKMRQVKIAIGSDGRNRTVLWPFAGKTGRSQPKASQWIFSPAVWMRCLIKPAFGRAVAYLDWSGMEFQIAGSQSNCRPMLDLYATGLPYIGFAQRVDAAPPGATKKSHPHIHERYKVGLLGAQYGMQHVTLARRLGITTFAAYEMLSQHHGLFSKYWAWVEDWVAYSLNTGSMHTTMGWTCAVGITELNARSIGNWITQATGADILRIACIEGHRRGLRLCGSVHDAVLIESSLEQIDADVALMQEIMRWASRIVLGDHELRTGVDIVRYPDRYTDARGTEMWAEVLRLLQLYQQTLKERFLAIA